HRAGGEELRAASRAVGEERQLAVLEGRSLTLEQPGERKVEGGGVGVAALARQTERGLALRRPAALEALVHRGLAEALRLHLDQPAVRLVGHLRERRVIEECREALEERSAALSVERRAIVGHGAGERVEVALEGELSVDQGLAPLQRPPEVVHVA